MKHALSKLFCSVALLLAACATGSTQPSEGAGALTIAPLEYQYRQLPNGLRVYAMPSTNTANVSVQVWYDVGSVDDPQGRSGFAHLFEHLMFKTTRNMPELFFDRLTEDVGGYNNASTFNDLTDYYAVVPANHLQRVLWAEAERMGSLVINEDFFESERDVVKEEYRSRVLASPYGRLFYLYLPQANFDVHPYGRPGIGSIEDLDAATIDDVRAFHATYYRPDNAVLVVAGNFDLAQFNSWVDQYFGPLTRPQRSIPRVEVTEPERAGPRDFTAYAPNVPLPAVLISYPQPEATDPSLPALMVLDAILASGQSSRLHHALVYEQQIATQVLTNLEVTQDPGVYTIGAIMSQGHSAEEGLAALAGELARVRVSGVTQAELDEAKNEVVTGTLQGRETAFGRAYELANAIVRYGDATYADRVLAAIQRTTAADVQRVARAVLDDNRRTVIRYLAAESRPEGATSDIIRTSARIQASPLSIPPSDVPVFTLAPEGQRVAPPPPDAPVRVVIPAIAERTLPNGLRVIAAPRRGLPLASAELLIGSGASSDPSGRAGLAGVTADLVTQGTATRTATEIASRIESLGASLTAQAGMDTSSVSLQSRSDRLDEAFELLADVVRNPAFSNEELERERQQGLDGLEVARSQPGTIASMVMSRAIYGDAPYGGVASPTSLRAIRREDVASYHATQWRPDNAILVVTGDMNVDEAFAMAERRLGDWRAPGAPPAAPDVTGHAPEPRTIVVDIPQTGQAAVVMGLLGVARRDADYFPVLVANEVLGGGYIARLNTEIRIRRGLSYGAYSSMATRLAPAPIIASAQTRNDAAVEVIGLMEREFRRLGDELAPDNQLAAAKASLIGSFGRSVETTSGLAGQISLAARFGIPPQELDSYVLRVGGVSAEQVRAAGRRYYDPAHADLVVAGDAHTFAEALRHRRPNAEQVLADEVNLDSQTLH